MSDTESDIEEKIKPKSKDKGKKGGKGKKEPKKKKDDDQGKKKKDDDDGKKKRGSKSKGKKQQKLDDESSSQLVLDYMTKQNRPYSLINIFDNLHAAVKKPILQKILQTLCQDEHLRAKDFNKNKIYMLNQNQFKISSEEMQGLTKELAELRDQQRQLEQEVKILQSQLRSLNSKPRLTQLVDQIKETKQMLVKLAQEKEEYGHDWKGVPKEDIESMQKAYAAATKESKKRQKLVKQSLKTCAQILQKKVAAAAQQIGVQLI